jgi:hypothetical protein
LDEDGPGGALDAEHLSHRIRQPCGGMRDDVAVSLDLDLEIAEALQSWTVEKPAMVLVPEGRKRSTFSFYLLILQFMKDVKYAATHPNTCPDAL